jgi:acid phosphatase (class A)
MTVKRPRGPIIIAMLAIAAGAVALWIGQHPAHYLTRDPAKYVALFAAPPAADSTQTRAELAELAALERSRSPADVAAAQADSKTDVSRFFGALGLPEDAPLPRLRALSQRVEDDIRPYVRRAKDQFRRLRPAAVDAELHPCIDDVAGDLSFPSGHATYGFVQAYLLAGMVPERRSELEARAEAYARQRMVCGVHFRSDIEAGRAGALWLVYAMSQNELFRHDSNEAALELRAALNLPALHAPAK